MTMELGFYMNKTKSKDKSTHDVNIFMYCSQRGRNHTCTYYSHDTSVPWCLHKTALLIFILAHILPCII